MRMNEKQPGLDKTRHRSQPEIEVGRGILDGLPIHHVTKDEWEQMGIVHPQIPSSLVDHPVTYVDRGGKYKEVGPTSLAPSGVRRKLNVMLKTPIELAINVQNLFTTLYMICQGFLGGLALAHLILAYNAVQVDTDLTSFMNVYASFARPYQALFYVLTLVCMMFALDRCDFNHFELLRSQPLALATLIVSGITLVLSCHTSYWDHRLTTGFHNDTLLVVTTQIELWKRLCISRCVGGIVAWLLISLLPSTNGIGFQLNCIHQSSFIQSQSTVTR